MRTSRPIGAFSFTFISFAPLAAAPSGAAVVSVSATGSLDAPPTTTAVAETVARLRVGVGVFGGKRLLVCGDKCLLLLSEAAEEPIGDPNQRVVRALLHDRAITQHGDLSALRMVDSGARSRSSCASASS